MKASRIQPDKNVSILLKAPPGFGKTLAAVSFAHYGPVWLAYFDKQTPIEIYSFFHKIGRKELLDNIEFERYGSPNAHEYLNQLGRFQANCPYIAIVTDSATTLTAAAVNWSMGWRDKSQPQGKMDKLNKDARQMIPDFDEYKVETSLVTQALDLSKSLPVFNIWTAHPLPQLNVTGSGANMVVTKSQTLVTYGNKVGAMIPGSFTEVYHLGRQVDKRIVFTDMAGDDFAKTAFNIPKQFDITDKLFAIEWKRLINDSFEAYKEVPLNEPVVDTGLDPFSKSAEPTKKKWEV